MAIVAGVSGLGSCAADGGGAGFAAMSAVDRSDRHLVRLCRVFGSGGVLFPLDVRRWRDDGRCVDRQATRAAEVFKVLSACQDHRMVGRKRRRRYGSRPAIERLGLARSSCSFGNDGEVVQGVGEIWMERTQLFFLNACGASQQLISGRKVACRRRAFRPIEQVTSVLLVSHGVSAAFSQSVGEQLPAYRSGTPTPIRLRVIAGICSSSRARARCCSCPSIHTPAAASP